MKKLFFLLFVYTLCVSHNAIAVPAYPRRIPIIIGNDTVYISLQGDEFNKYAMDEEGYTLLQTHDGWHYATKDSKGNVVSSDFKLTSKRQRSNALQHFLKTQQRNIKPVINKNIEHTANITTANSSKVSVTGLRRVLVILMQFRDKPFTRSTDDFIRLFNEENYREDGATGSVHDYYKFASYGQLNLQSDIIGPYTSKQNMEFYGGNTITGGGDKNPYALFEEALNNAINDVNLSEYDSDGDGFVDNIHIIYAGHGEEAGASANAIWAHEMTFSPKTVQGMKINKYSCAPELRGNMGNGISRIGPHCHEIGHALGAMDYYDTNYEADGYYQGTGLWDIMASGSWNNDGISPANFNPYVKVYDYGWTEARSLQTGTENIIHPSYEKGNIYRLDTGKEQDFFLIENRQQTQFDEMVPSEGLLIFHIGPNIKEKAYTNTINSTFPQQCYPVCASAQSSYPTSEEQSFGAINSAGCPYPGNSNNSEFSDTSIPAALTFGRNKTGICLTDIRKENENIVLYCENAGHTNPDDFDDPQEENIVWQENFENLSLSDFWTYKDSIGNGSITIYNKITGEDTPKSPNPANGHGYAKYMVQETNIIKAQRSYGRLSGKWIELDTDSNYKLQTNVRKYSATVNSHDSLRVHILTNDGMEQIYLMEIQSQDYWDSVLIPLYSHCERCRISIDLNADHKSWIFLDNIKIIRNHETNRITPTKVENDYTPIIYDITGRKTTLSSPGLKIIQAHGKVTKVFVK